MFKNLFAFIDAPYSKPETDFEKKFFDNITKFAFHDELDATCQRLYGAGIATLTSEGRYKDVVKALLHADGMSYGQKPKGLLKFHSYPDGPRTPVEEHLTESALYAKDSTGTANLHFTVSAEHQALFETLLKNTIPQAQQRLHTHSMFRSHSRNRQPTPLPSHPTTRFSARLTAKCFSDPADTARS